MRPSCSCPTLIEAFADDDSRDRSRLLAGLAGKRGFYVPSLYEVEYAGPGRVAAITPRPGTTAPPVVRKAAVAAIDRLDPPSTSIFTPDTEFGSRLLIEVVRGCANLCRFCWAGYNYLPVRPFSTSRILEIAEAARPYANRVGLVSIALCDHPDIELILSRLIEMGYGISPASLRLDDLTETIVSLLRQSGERSITIAPETGSDRLRRVINKTVTNDEILDRAALIFRSGIENLKLYYMIGLPTETDDDLVALRDLTIAIREVMVDASPSTTTIGRVVASVNPLIPKPGTTYQWLPMTEAGVIEAKIERLRGLVAGLDNVFFNIKSERHSYYQGLLSLGDRRVADVIELAEQNGGNWRAAAAEAGVDADAYLYRDRSQDAFLPWQIIDGGFKTGFFRSELEKSFREEWTLPPKRQRENAARTRPTRFPSEHRSGLRARCHFRMMSERSSPRTVRSPRRSRTSCSLYASRIRSRSLSCRDESAIGRNSEKLRRSPFTEYARAGKVTFRPPFFRSQIANPISLSPSSGPPEKWSSASASLPGGVPLSFGRNFTVMSSSLRIASAPAGHRRQEQARRQSRLPLLVAPNSFDRLQLPARLSEDASARACENDAWSCRIDE